jgi:hypothetical protein
MKYFLVDWDDNWADEMDLRGFCIMSEKQMELYFAAYKKIFDQEGTLSVGCGTNQEIDYNTYKDFMRSFSWQEITADDKKRIEFLFGLQAFIGDDPDLGPIPDNVLPEDELPKYGKFPWDDFSAYA